MKTRALFFAVLAILFFSPPVSLHAQAIAPSQQCALDNGVTDGGQAFNQCPFGQSLNYLITQGYNGARLDTDDALSRTPLYLYADNLCRYVDARGTAAALFIPFNSQPEWSAFINNTPSGVHTAQCCLPRPLKVGDVPPISAVPNVAACTGGWQFNGLVDPTNFNRLLAAPAGTTAGSGFALQAGVSEDPDYPITGLPIERDDIAASLPTGARGSQSYVAKYSCVSTSGNTTSTQVQLIQFDMKCGGGAWAYSGAACQSGTIGLFSEPCADGSTGSIYKQVSRSCPSGDVTVQTVSNSCQAACVPGLVGATFTAPCPAGQTGVITRGNFRQCPANTTVVQDISNTCTTPATCTAPDNICPTGSAPTCTASGNGCSCSCSGTCPAGQTDLGIAYSSCMNGQNGVIQTHSFRTCTSTNNQCVCSLSATEEDNCSTGATCTPAAMPAACPSGQASTCTPSGPGGQCNCLCAPSNNTCTPRTVTDETRSCPDGQTGALTVEVTKICQSSQPVAGGTMQPDANGCFCTTSEKTLTTTCATTPPASCVPSTDLGNSTKACPNGQAGAITVDTKKICTPTVGCAQGGPCTGGCSCHNEETEVSRTCQACATGTTDLGNSTQACPAGQSGSITVDTKRSCVSSNNACTCTTSTTPVSNTCTPTVTPPASCVPSTAMGQSSQACPSGQSGSITVSTKKVCSTFNGNVDPSLSGYGTTDPRFAQCVCHTETTQVSNTCTAASCTPSADSGTKVLACPAGQSGSGITVHVIKECSACNGQCTCVNRYTVLHDDCGAVCTPRTDLGTKTLACPAGQTGSITVNRVKVCAPCNGSQCLCSTQEIPVSNTCAAIQQCTPSSHSETAACPAGQSGSIVKTIQHLCDCAGGRDVVTSVSNSCTTVNQCVPSSHTESGSCPAGYAGSIVKTVQHVCDCPGGRDVVTNVSNMCVRVNQCTPSSHVTTTSCPNGQSGSITTTVTHTCPDNQDHTATQNMCVNACVASSHVSTRSCPNGQSGSITTTTSHTCPDNQDNTVMQNTCVNSCTPSTASSTRSCPAGYAGTITMTVTHTCPDNRTVTRTQNNCTPVAVP